MYTDIICRAKLCVVMATDGRIKTRVESGKNITNVVIVSFILLSVPSTITCNGNDGTRQVADLYRNNHGHDADRNFCKSPSGCPESEHDVVLFRLDGHKEGHVQEVELQDEKKHLLKTVNMKPLIFEVEDFFTDEECDHMIQLAKEQGLQMSSTHNHEQINIGMRLLDVDGDERLSLTEMRRTIEDGFDIYLLEGDLRKLYSDLALDRNQDEFISKDEMGNISPSQLRSYLSDLISREPGKKSRLSSQAWIYPDKISDPLVYSFQRRISKLTRLPDTMIEGNNFIQVVRYTADGHYNAHHDSGDDYQYPCCHLVTHKRCNICRYATIMVYLNDVEKGGETAFPVANNETYNEEIFRASGKMNLNHYCQDANLKLLPRKGTAVLWYNHFVNETTGWMGPVDKFTWHGGCPVLQGSKWIMNRWIAASPDRENDLSLYK